MPRLFADAAEGDWPRTGRLLPWLLAGFLVMLWLVPFDAIALPVHLPFDSKLDRFFLGILLLLWFGSMLVGGSVAGGTRRLTLIHVGALLFLATAVASVLVNMDTLMKLGEWAPSIKKLAVIVTYIAFMCIVATVVRPGELRAFCTLIVVLASLTAIGTIYEFHSDTNVFFSWAQHLPGGFHVTAAQGGIDSSGRQGTTGPTQHGLAVATMLALAFPFAIVGFLRARKLSHKVLYTLSMWLLLAGAVATERKSGVLVPVAAFLTLLAYRPGQMVRVLPVLVIAVAAVPILSPGAATTVEQHLIPALHGKESSTASRTEDYQNTQPDVLSHIAIGRGYGSYDPTRYGFLDNQYLSILVGAGVLGVAAYLLMVFGTLAVAHSVIKTRDPVRGPPALACAAAAVAFALATAFFGVLGYPQVPYIFLFMAGMAAACASAPEEKPAADDERLEVMTA